MSTQTTPRPRRRIDGDELFYFTLSTSALALWGVLGLAFLRTLGGGA